MKIFSFSLILFFLFCCSSKIEKDFDDNCIDINNTYVWINLMPGGSPKLFFTCELYIHKNIIDFKIDEVSLYQDENYKNKFDVKYEPVNDTSKISRSKFMMVSAEGISSNNINLESNVYLIFHFKFGNKYYNREVKNIKIEKVY